MKGSVEKKRKWKRKILKNKREKWLFNLKKKSVENVREKWMFNSENKKRKVSIYKSEKSA